MDIKCGLMGLKYTKTIFFHMEPNIKIWNVYNL
jgi:hypothetical protein